MTDLDPWDAHDFGDLASAPLADDDDVFADSIERPAWSADWGQDSVLPLIDPATWADVDLPARRWAWAGYIPHRQATYLTGPGSAGKSLLAQQLCTAIALGVPFLGTETAQAVAVYVTCEDDPDELHRRQKAICASLRVNLSDLSGKLHLVSLAGALQNDLVIFNPEGLLETLPCYKALETTLQTIGAGFVALDNVAHLFPEEIARNKVAAQVNLLNRLAGKIDGSVLFLGHPNKAGQDFSGSTAWENQVRSRLFMECPKDSEGSAIDPDMRVLRRGKSNYARNGEEVTFRWMDWAFVAEHEIPADKRAEMAETIQATRDNEIFLQCLDERNRQERTVSESPASRTYAPKEFAAMAESKKIGRARLEAAMDRLFRIGEIERGFVYRDGGEGKDRHGLRRPPKNSADLPADLPLTPSADIPLTARRPPPAHTPISKDIEGAASGAAAPPYASDGGPT